MDITTLALNLPNWHFGGTTAELRIYALQTFKSGTACLVAGNYPEANWYQKVVCTVSGTTLQIPAVTLASTTDSDNPNAQYVCVLLDYRKNVREFFLAGSFKVPISFGASVHWEDLRIWNRARQMRLPETYLTSEQTVQLIIRQLEELDFAVASVNGLTGAVTLTTDEIPEGTNLYFTEERAQNALSGDFQLVSQKGVANGYAPLNSSGKVPSENLPPITVNNMTVVANQAARLALTAVIGDGAKQSDTGETFLLSALPASTNANWIPISDISPDWTVITNKPTFGTASALNAPASGNASASEVAKGNDTRFVPAGGTAHQILEKINSVDFNTQWVEAPLGGDIITGSIPFEDDAGADDPIDLVEGSPGGGTGAVDSVNGLDGVVVLDTDDILEGATHKYNQTHTGDVTGSVALTIGDNKVLNQHIVSVVATKVTEDSTHRFATDTEKTTWNAKASLDSPAFINNPTAPTQTAGNSTTRLATTEFVGVAIAALINSSPGLLDTLDEIAAALGDDPNFAATMTSALAGKIAKSANLSDLVDPSAARGHLGLGAIALLASIATANLDNDAVTYAKIQNVTATDKLLGRSTAGAGDVEEIACTAAGRAILAAVDAAAQRTALGLGALALLATVGASQIDTNAVTTVKITDANVTTAKIANNAITPAKRAALVALTDGATVALDASLSEKFKLTSSLSQTIGVPTNPTNGQTIIIVFRNSAGTSQTLSLTTGSAGAFKFTDAVAALSATPAGKTDLITTYYDADVARWLVVGYAKEP